MAKGRNVFREELPGKLGVTSMRGREEDGLSALRVTPGPSVPMSADTSRSCMCPPLGTGGMCGPLLFC